VIGPEAAKWVLCDGRNVAGSRYATVTGQTTVPDLRGAFIRCAGQNSNAAANWNGGAVGAFHQDTTRAPRNTALTGVTNNAGSHSHTGDYTAPRYGARGGGDVNPANPGGGGNDSLNGHLRIDANGDHTHTVTINGGGDSETAPVHFGLNTFIKIN
jgi:hypothetical protein